MFLQKLITGSCLLQNTVLANALIVKDTVTRFGAPDPRTILLEPCALQEQCWAITGMYIG